MYFAEREADPGDPAVKSGLLLVRERGQQFVSAGARLIQVFALAGRVMQFEQEQDDPRRTAIQPGVGRLRVGGILGPRQPRGGLDS
jgi:hypothetical protein